MESVLSIRDLSVAFSSRSEVVEAVRGVSLEIPPGHTVAIVGESGSGKSTTAMAVNRLLPANAEITAGEIHFDGRDLLRANTNTMTQLRGAGIGLVPQDPMSNLNPLIRVGEQVAEALRVHGRERGSAARARAVELLEEVGIGQAKRRYDQYPHEFSGGMRQRALIAMGLACQPRLLIADEPTSALDVTLQRRILDRIATLTGEMGTSVLLITHDLALAAERADTVAVMYRGEIVETGPAGQILAEPEHDYTQRLLDAAVNPATPQLSTESTSAAGNTPLVTVSGLTKRFRMRAATGEATEFTAVDNAHFTIPRGNTVSIVGESGSGKSTIANLVLGLQAPSAGTVSFDGCDIATMKRRELFAFRRRVQPVFQNPYASLDPRYTVGAAIAEPLRVHKIGNRAARATTVTSLLDKVALPSTMAQRYPHELSGGQRQRVAIARALALSPELIVLDEAVSALDVLVRSQILELLGQLQNELGLTYLFVSHDLAVVRAVSHSILVMKDGCLIESGTPEHIFTKPEHDYTRELLAAIPGAARD